MDGSPILAAAAGFALLLGTASWQKLNGLVEFRELLADYRLVPAVLLRPAALVIVIAEAALAAAWIVAPWHVGVAGVAGVGTTILMAAYGGGIAANLVRGRSWIDCGCGGGEQLSWVLVARNAVLAMFALAPLAIADSGRPTWSDLAVSAPVFAVATLLYLATRTLLLNTAAMASLGGARR
ncbi:MAG: methylamine utilization protein MauE [Gammaproteobacteria bacterium]|nr:methylamine utilization protein MauE [Gammaproteobacteria bacterium]